MGVGGGSTGRSVLLLSAGCVGGQWGVGGVSVLVIGLGRMRPVLVQGEQRGPAVAH